MPIPVSELRKPQLADRILDLLRQDPTQAYSLLEILSEMLGVPVAQLVDDRLSEDEKALRVDPVFTAIRQLVSDGRIEECERADDFYFFAREGA